jgi:hypothetical protein
MEESFNQSSIDSQNALLENGSIQATIESTPTLIPRNQRGAFRELKVTKLRGHEYLPKYFTHPTFCSLCNEFLWYF